MGNVENWFVAAKLILDDKDAEEHLQDISDISKVPLHLLKSVFDDLGNSLTVVRNREVIEYLSK